MFEFRNRPVQPVIYKAMHSDNTKIAVQIPYADNMRQDLKEVLAGGHVEFNREAKMWEIASKHIEVVADYLVKRYGACELQIVTSTTELCTTSCKSADIKKTPVSKCECVCGGHGHGDGWPEGWKLASSQGELLVKGNRKVEIFTIRGELLKRRPVPKEDRLPRGVHEVVWGGRPAYAFDADTSFSRWVDDQEVR